MKITFDNHAALRVVLLQIGLEMDVIAEGDGDESTFDRFQQLAAALRPSLAQETQAQNDQPMVYELPEALRDVATAAVENARDVQSLTGVLIDP